MAKVRRIIWMLGFLATAWVQAEEIKILGVHAPFAASGPRLTRILRAVHVSGRNLASIRVYASSISEKAALESQEGYPVYFAPAWFSSDWRLVEVGEKAFVPDWLMSPRYSDLTSDQNDYSPRRFPYILARDPYAVGCPYVYGFPTQFWCLNEHLQVQGRYQLPMACNGYRIIDGQLWVIGLHEGFLAHRYDFQEKGLTEHAIPLDTVRIAIKAKGFKEEDISHIKFRESSEETKRKVETYLQSQLDLIEQLGPREQLKQRFEDFQRPLFSLPSSFQFDLATDGKKAGILIRKPMGLIVADWPDGKNASFLPVTKEDLPPAFLNLKLSKLYVVGVEMLGGNNFFGYFQTLVPLTYGELLAHQPDAAKKFKNSMTNPSI